MTNKITVVNLFGGAGVGKTGTAHQITSLMKRNGDKCEYGREYAKILTYENNMDKVKDQTALLAAQHTEIYTVRNLLDYIVMDSPMLLCPVYDIYKSKSLCEHAIELHNRYKSINFYIKRETDYDPVGRYHTLEESMVIDDLVYKFLVEKNIPFIEIGKDCGQQVYDIIKNMNFENERTNS